LFVPEKPTAVMRIFSKNSALNMSYGPLRRSPNWVWVVNYFFDYIVQITADEMDRLSRSTSPEDLEYAYLSRDLAGEIVYNFNSVRPEIECLMIHCKGGISRSPAVAIALNEVFELGHDKLPLQYPDFNLAVYQMVRDAGLELLKQSPPEPQ